MLAFQLVMMVFAPVLILPLFNKFAPLPEMKRGVSFALGLVEGQGQATLPAAGRAFRTEKGELVPISEKREARRFFGPLPGVISGLAHYYDQRAGASIDSRRRALARPHG